MRPLTTALSEAPMQLTGACVAKESGRLCARAHPGTFNIKVLVGEVAGS